MSKRVLRAHVEQIGIINKIHDFCFGPEMIDKGCVNCPLNDVGACDENASMSRKRKASRLIDKLTKEENKDEHDG